METRSQKAKPSPYVYKNVLTTAGEPRPRIALKERQQILKLKGAGWSNRAIGKKLHHTTTGVGDVIKRFYRTGDLKDKPHLHRRGKIPPKLVKQLVGLLENGTLETWKDCVGWLRKHHNVTVTRNTVLGALRKVGQREYIQQAKPFVSKETAKDRLTHATEWIRTSKRRWFRTIFSDEKEFTLNPRPRKRRVLLKYPAKFDARRMLPRLCKSSASVRIWAAITSSGILAYSFYEGTLTAATYKKILSQELLPKAKKAFGKKVEWIFQQDNAPAHTAATIQHFLEDKDITVLYWPPHSPDLNLIENLWAELNRKIAARKPSSKENLKKAIIEGIEEMNREESDRHYFENLYASMPKRLQQVIASGGLPTPH